MYKQKFDELVKKGIITQEENNKIYSQMSPNEDGRFIGVLDRKVNYKYYTTGDIFDKPLIEYIKTNCATPLGMDEIDDTFKTYGTSSREYGMWSWFTKENITEYDIQNGHRPIEEATNEELWKMLAMSSMYWKGCYMEWYNKSKKKTTLLNSFIGECERKYFGYDECGYTTKTIERIFNSIYKILDKCFEDKEK